MMEKKLKALFDYQKFAHNPRLDAILAQTETGGVIPLEDTALEDVNAAGDPAYGYRDRSRELH